MAAELTRLILKAFRDNGGVITPAAGEEAPPSEPAGATEPGVPVAAAAAEVAPAQPAPRRRWGQYLSDLVSGPQLERPLADTLGLSSGGLAEARTMYGVLPNPELRGGPAFLQVLDIVDAAAGTAAAPAAPRLPPHTRRPQPALAPAPAPALPQAPPQPGLPEASVRRVALEADMAAQVLAALPYDAQYLRSLASPPRQDPDVLAGPIVVPVPVPGLQYLQPPPLPLAPPTPPVYGLQEQEQGQGHGPWTGVGPGPGPMQGMQSGGTWQQQQQQQQQYYPPAPLADHQWQQQQQQQYLVDAATASAQQQLPPSFQGMASPQQYSLPAPLAGHHWQQHQQQQYLVDAATASTQQQLPPGFRPGTSSTPLPATGVQDLDPVTWQQLPPGSWRHLLPISPSATDVLQPGAIGYAGAHKLQAVQLLRQQQLYRQQRRQSQDQQPQQQQKAAAPGPGTAPGPGPDLDSIIREVASRLPPTTRWAPPPTVTASAAAAAAARRGATGSPRGRPQWDSDTRAAAAAPKGGKVSSATKRELGRYIQSSRSRRALVDSDDEHDDQDAAVARAPEPALSAGEQAAVDARDLRRASMIGVWVQEMRGLSSAVARMEAAKEAVHITRQQADKARKEREAAELAGLLGAMQDLDLLAGEVEADTASTKRVMQLVEEEQELRHRLHLQSLFLETRRVAGHIEQELGGAGGAVDAGGGAQGPGFDGVSPSVYRYTTKSGVLPVTDTGSGVEAAKLLEELGEGKVVGVKGEAGGGEGGGALERRDSLGLGLGALHVETGAGTRGCGGMSAADPGSGAASVAGPAGDVGGAGLACGGSDGKGAAEELSAAGSATVEPTVTSEAVDDSAAAAAAAVVPSTASRASTASDADLEASDQDPGDQVAISGSESEDLGVEDIGMGGESGSDEEGAAPPAAEEAQQSSSDSEDLGQIASIEF